MFTIQRRHEPRRGARVILLSLVVLLTLMQASPAVADPTPVGSPTPSEEAKPAEKKGAVPTPSPAPSPSESGSASPEPSQKPSTDPSETTEPKPSESGEPSESPKPSESGEPSASAEPSEPAGTTEPQAEDPNAPDDGEIVPQVVPPATGNNAVITVKVGGDRTSQTAVGNLQGVQLALYANAGDATPVTGFTSTCTSDADGDCSFTVPNTQAGPPAGANRDRRFWVKQVSTASGYYTNPNLGTGTTAASDPYRFQTGTQLRNGTIYRSTVDFMISTGNTNNEASSGIWQNSRNNPSFPAQCGINVALVLDLSGSVGSDLPNLKAAANVFVNSLVGTPSAVGVFTFATSAPAAGAPNTTLPLTPVSTSATTVTNKINGLVLGTDQEAGTNWDRGIYQVAQSPSTFDVAVVITDGNPTFYAAGEGPGNRTRFREVENGIFSANAVKAEDTRVIAFGVGGGVANPASGLNLRSISGTTAGSDYYQTTNYAAAGDQLKALAQGACQSSLTVVKQVVPSTTPAGSIAGATPAGGWSFAGAGSANVSITAPTTRTTAAGTGAVNFPLTFTGGATTGPVTLTETLQSGYVLQQVGGFNAVCTRIDNGASVPVTNSGTVGFTVNAASTYPVSCTVYNRAPNPPASVVINKTWSINGTTYAEGTQPAGFIATGTINGTNQPWGVVRSGLSQGATVSIGETINSYPTQCAITAQRLTSANGATVNLTLPSTQTLAGGANTYGITNILNCPTKLTLDKSVRFGTAAPTSWTLDAVAPVGALAGPNGVAGSPGATGVEVTPGVTYPLAESGGPLEYMQFIDPNATLIPGSTGSWTCVEVGTDGTTVIPGFADGLNGGVTVPLGLWVRCTAINETAQIRLVKEVINNNGGTAQPQAWTLQAAPTGTFPAGLPTITTPGATLANAQAFSVRPGVTYNVSESGGPPGYTQTAIECIIGDLQRVPLSLVSLAPGQIATCFVVNDDQPAQLTLVKTVTNDNGGTAVPTAWTLAAAGPTPISGTTGSAAVTNAAVSAGTYTLSESGGPSGYTASGWTCTGGTVTGSSVVVANAGTVVCTINNNDIGARLTLVKTVTNDNGGTAVPTAWTLAASGPTPISGPTGSAPVTNALVNAGSYTLSESGGPGGYTAGSWSCIGGTLAGSTVILAPGGSATCTINNNDRPANLTLIKTVTNDNGGTALPTAWTLAAAGPTPISGVTDTAPVTRAPVNSGTYTLSESGGPAGYTPEAWACTGGAAPVTGSTVVVPTGGNVVCTINNNDQPAQLTLIKTVTNDNGGTAVPTDWTLTATGPTTGVTGTTGSPAVTDAVVSAGSYTLAESGGPAGYAPGAWSCTGGTVTGASVVVPNGGDVTCTISNNDQPAQLTLVKSVTNDNGGTAVPTAWTLTATGPTTGVTGTTGSPAVTDAPVSAGTYTLAESGGPSGYTAGAWSCIGGTLTGASVVVPNGGDVTCTINNDDQSALLTLIKVVDNGATGATTPATAWTLTATGPTTGVTGATGSAAVTDAVVSAGSYTLAESGGPAGYAESAWSCTGGTVTGASVVVPNGGDVTCTITNTAEQPTLTLVKTVTNDNGGTGAPIDWTLAAAGPTPGVSGAVGDAAVTDVPVAIGDYVLSESGGPAGYSAGAWSCTGGTLTGSTVTVGLGEDVTCTINNDDQSALLTLIKAVDNGATGATSPATAWTLTATGPTTGVTGATGSAAVTDAVVSAGSYTLAESGGPAGYAESAWSCTGGTVTGASVVVPNGGDVTCTITNTAEQPTLTLVKTVTNDNGGTGAPIDWTLAAAGPTPGVSGAVGDAAVTDVPVAIGDYVLSESGGPAGYSAGAWSCTGGTLTGSTVTVGLGEDVTCTINNNDQLGTWDLAKSSAPATGATVKPGGMITYTLTATKTGGVDSTDVTISDDLAAVLNNATVVTGPTPSSGLATIAGTTMTWTIPILSDEETVTYTVRVNDDAHGVTLTNVATGGGSTSCPVGSTDCSTTHFTPHYVLEKSSDPDSGSSVNPGDTIEYTLTATNDSEAVLTDAVVTDDLSNVLNNATLVSVGPDGNVTGTTLTWTIPELEPGESETLEYSLKVNDDAFNQTIGNVATPGQGGECVEACETEHPTPGWNFTKSSDPVSGSTVQPGGKVTYTLLATNTSQAVVTDAVVIDDLSDVLDNATLDSVPDGATLTGTTLTWTVPTLPLGGSATLRYTVTVNEDAFRETLHNVATPGPGGECVPFDPVFLRTAMLVAALAAEDPVCETTHQTPGWTLEKSSDPASGSTVQPGSSVTYTLTATNDSEGVVTGAVATDDLSDVLNHASLDAVPEGATLTGTTLTWNIPELEPGESETLTYSVTIDSDAYNATIGNVVTPGPGGSCVGSCSTDHNTPPPTEPPLPQTGTGASLDLGVIGLGLIVAGAYVLIRRRSGRTAS